MGGLNEAAESVALNPDRYIALFAHVAKLRALALAFLSSNPA